ncbi:hypothetical protein Peur_002011 [Populus x canadensis]
MKSRCEHAAPFKNGEDEIQIARETSRLGLENQLLPGFHLRVSNRDSVHQIHRSSELKRGRKKADFNQLL